MAKLSNINNLFSVDSTGAIEFSTQVGTTGYVLESRGAGNAPVWTDRDTGRITGSGAANRVTYWTGTYSISSDAGFTYNGAGRVNTDESFGVSKDGADTVADGPFFRLTNAAQNRQYLNQLDASNNIDYWYYNGTAWTQTISLLTDGGANFTGSVTGVRLFSASGGNKTNPMIAVATDQDTGIFFPAANTMAFSAGDTESLRFTGANSTFAGNILMGNTVTNPASGFADQTGIGLKNSTTVPEIQVSSDSAAMQLGRTSTGGEGQILGLRKAGNIIHNFDTNNVSIGTNATFAGQIQVDKTKSGTGVENYDLIRLNLSGTGAVGDSSTIGWFSTSGTKTAGIEGISGLDNILYGELAFHVRRYTTDTYDRVMTIDNRGNVGIGTVSPQTILDVRSSTGTSYPEVLVKWDSNNDSTAPTASLLLSPGAFSANNTAPRIVGYRTANFQSAAARSAGLIFGVSQNNAAKEAVRITESGLTIFKSSYIAAGSYGGELNIGGSSVTTFGLQAKYNQGGATQSTLYSSPGYTSNDQLFLLGAGAGNTAQLVLQGNGNVGINNTAPAKKLEISSPTNADGILLTGDGTGGGMATGNYRSIGFSYTDTDTSYGSEMKFEIPDSANHGGQISFWTDEITGTGSSIRAMTIDRSQNVGIGIQGPDVSGAGSSSTVLSVIETVGNRRGILELGDNQNADTGGIGSINFVGTYQDAGHKIMAEIRASGSGATSGQRGSYISMFTKANGTAAIAERMRITSDGKIIANGASPGGFYLDGANRRFYGNGGGGTDWRGVEVSPSGLWSWGETGLSNYFAKDMGIGVVPTTTGMAGNIRVLQIGERGVFSAYTNSGNVYMSCNVRVLSNGNNVAITSGVAGQYRIADDQHVWYSAVTANAGAVQSLVITAKIDNAGTFTAKGDVVAYGSPSDKRLKENIKPIKSALEKVSKLQGVTFNWKKSDSILDIKEDIGFIAQDVQKVIPELIRENDNGMLSMRHQGIAPILLEAIKELKAEIEELKSNKCNCNK